MVSWWLKYHENMWGGLHFHVVVAKPLLNSIWHSLKEKKDNLNMNLVQFIVFWWCFGVVLVAIQCQFTFAALHFSFAALH